MMLAASLYLSAAEESTISIMDLASEREQLVIKTPGLVMEVKFSPDGTLLVGGFQRGNYYFDYVWDVSTGELLAELMDYQYGLTFSPDSSTAVAAKGEKVSVFSTSNWALLNNIGFADPYRDVAPKSFSPDGSILAGEDRDAILFNKLDTGEQLYVLPDECDVRFSPTGRILITWCYQGDLKIWGATQ
jgi:WD40 repeat protein